MKNKLIGISIFSIIGFAISAYQTFSFYELRAGTMIGKRFCEIGTTFDCTSIEMSRFAELIPGIPLSGFAMAAYLFLLFLSLIAHLGSERKNVLNWIRVCSWLSVAFSAVYLAIMVGIIKKLCLLCLGIDVLNVAILATAWSIHKGETQTWNPFNRSAMVSAGVAALVAAMISSGMNPAAKFKSEDLADWKESIFATPRVTLQVPDKTPSIGSPTAPITIVKFSDYQCPSCKMSASILHSLMKRYKDEVRFVFLNYPLSNECNPKLKSAMHAAACEAARAAYCGFLQGKFEETYVALFEHQEDLKPGKIGEILKGANLPADDILACMNLPSTAERIKTEVDFGDSINLMSTPTFYVDGIKVEGGMPTNLWIEVIDTLLKQKKGH